MRQDQNRKQAEADVSFRLRFGLKTKILAISVALFMISAVAAAIWGHEIVQNQGLQHAESQATALCDQMDAVWSYVELHQSDSNAYARELGENARGLVCVNAVKSVARNFNDAGAGEIGVVSLRPRNDEDSPDGFEREALEAFQADSGLSSFAGVAEKGGEQVYYYLRPKRIISACLICHGGPEGELDPVGYKREGYAVGDVVGAFSVREPLASTTAEARGDVLRGIALFLACLVAFVAIMYVTLELIVVRRLERVAAEASAYRPGKELSIRDYGASDEIALLSHSLNAMGTELNGLYANLESRVEERTAELNRLNGELEREREKLADTLKQLSAETDYKTRHFAALSHDLRVPLTSIIAYVQIAHMVSRKAERPTGAQAGSAEPASIGVDELGILDQIAEKAQTMSSMIDNMLAYARADTQGVEVHPAPLDLDDFASELCALLNPIAQRKNVQLGVGVGASRIVRADADLLMRVMGNLVGNALKFTPSGGHVRVAIEVHEDGGLPHGKLAFVVEDDGIGVSPADEPVIFLPYTMGGDGASSACGVGLGLAVVRQIADALGGDVAYERRSTSGSRFTFTCPVDVLEEGERL